MARTTPGQETGLQESERRAKTVAVSTPLLERRRKISTIGIILASVPPFSKHPYIRAQARAPGSESHSTSRANPPLCPQPVPPHSSPAGSHQGCFGV
jgi:hypothetical protein